MSIFPMKCPRCHYREEVQGSVGQVPQRFCVQCFDTYKRVTMVRDLGRHVEFPPINFGWRGEAYYPTEEDSNIAKYQFEHLK